VVVEPAQIVAEAPLGLRALFVALTRCTSRLALVHAQPLPARLELEATPSPSTTPDEAISLPMPAGTNGAGRRPVEHTAPANGQDADAVQLVADEFDGLEHDLAAAIAATVADKLSRHISPALVPLVVDELVRRLRPVEQHEHSPH
jgi:hypothetical protein